MEFKGFSILELLQSGEHQAKDLLNWCQKNKVIKQCYHAMIVKYPGGYKVECAKQSFDFEKTSYSESTFLGCPENCLAYKTELRGKINKYWFNCFYLSKSFIRNRWNDFLGLSPWVQMLIIAVVALIFKASSVYEMIMDIIKHKLS